VKQFFHCKENTYGSSAWFSCRWPTCSVVAGSKRQCSAICSSGSPAHLWWIADILKLGWNANPIGAIFDHFICKAWDCGKKIELLRHTLHLQVVQTTLTYNIFIADNRQQLLACLQSWTQLNFAGKSMVNAWDRLWFGNKCSDMLWRCPRLCRWLCLRAYENQAFLSNWI